MSIHRSAASGWAATTTSADRACTWPTTSAAPGRRLAGSATSAPSRRGREQLEEYFAGDPHGVRRGPGAAGQPVPGRGVDAPCGPSRTGRRPAMPTSPGPSAGRPRSGPSGAANGRNPISIIVPCHRVIGADGTPHRLRLGRRPQGLAARPRARSPARSSPSAGPSRSGQRPGVGGLGHGGQAAGLPAHDQDDDHDDEHRHHRPGRC